MGIYEVHQDQLWGSFVKRHRGIEVLEFLRKVRLKYPYRIRLYIILDNLSAHRTPEIRSWTRQNNVSLVYTATNASWMNKIEPQFDNLSNST
jgi:transposase